MPSNRISTPAATADQYRSCRLKTIAVSEILQIGARAQALRQTGTDVIVLAAGEPDFDTPAHIKAAAAFRGAVASGKPSIIHCSTDPEAITPSRSLSRIRGDAIEAAKTR